MEAVLWLSLASLAAVLLCGRRFAFVAPYLVSACFAGGFLAVVQHVSQSTQVAHWGIQWSRFFGLSLDFRFDGLTNTMLALILFIGSGVFLYAAAYMRQAPRQMSFYLTLTLFSVAMLGLVATDNMLAFFVFWETTSICSFLLVGTKYSKSEVGQAARKALFVTAGGGLWLLLGIMLISWHGQQQGLTLASSLNFSEVDSSILSSSVFLPVLVCIAVAVATKSAQLPFHFWLPAAMAGPTPVSSFLHSATMVKAGVYLVARLTPVMAEHPWWRWTFTIMGAATLLYGALMSAAQRDMKKMLAFSTIAVLGGLVMLLGMGTPASLQAAVVFLVAHALYKAALFQAVGNIDFATGNRGIFTLRGLGRYLPTTAAATGLAALSMAGFPPFLGFYAKELTYLADLIHPGWGWPLLILTFAANVLLVGVALAICYKPFWTQPPANLQVKQLPWAMAAPPVTMALVGLMVGLVPGPFTEYFAAAMVDSVAGTAVGLKLKLWHGVDFNSLMVLGTSLLTLGLGWWAASRFPQLQGRLGALEKRLQGFGADACYQWLVEAVPRQAGSVMSWLQDGDLKKYLQIILLASLVLVGQTLQPALSASGLHFETPLLELVLATLIALPVLAALERFSHVARVVLLSASGLGLVVAFIAYGAPDLALTQLLVEALLLIFLLVLAQQVGLRKVEEKRFGVVNVVVATGGALGLCLLMMSDFQVLPDQTSKYYLTNALSEAFGRNVVNVILVDFRALDTFGEVVVVAVAALGVGSIMGRSQDRHG